MADEKKAEEITVHIYKEIPGDKANNIKAIEAVKEEKAGENVSKKIAEKKQADKEKEKTQNDTSGEDG